MVTVIFIAIASLIIASAVLVVVSREIVRAALWLIATFFAVGALYLLLEAEFIGVAQVLVYVGAVAILILFAIMLTRQHEWHEPAWRAGPWWIALAGVIGLAAVLVTTIGAVPWRLTDDDLPVSRAPQLGTALMREYLLPFQLAAIVLLVALIGAVVVAMEERRRRIPTLADDVAAQRGAADRAEDGTP